MPMAPRNLLLCFDAFGTLFRPRYSITKQYGDVARALGHRGFSDDELAVAFKAAFKQESSRHPNYGKADGMNAEKWWTNIIHNTFRPLIRPDQPLHRELVPKLLHRFSCDEGYTLYPDVLPLLKALRQAHERNGSKLVVGVITNSDDRVPDVLTALGMRVSTLRYGTESNSSSTLDDQLDIHFSIMSYDVGYEKPDPRIFSAAEDMLRRVLSAEIRASPAHQDLERWHRVYIGDEYDKDVVGALSAGWNAVLIERDGTGRREDVAWMDDRPTGSLYDALDASPAIGFRSLAKLAEWLPRGA